MIQKINKRYMAINCPLCDYTYIADKGEYSFIDVKVSDAFIDENYNFHPSIYDTRILFHCPDCDRDIKSDKYENFYCTDDRVKLIKDEMRGK